MFPDRPPLVAISFPAHIHPPTDIIHPFPPVGLPADIRFVSAVSTQGYDSPLSRAKTFGVLCSSHNESWRMPDNKVPSRYVLYGVPTGYDHQSTSASWGRAQVSPPHLPHNNHQQSLSVLTDTNHLDWRSNAPRTAVAVDGSAQRTLKAQPIRVFGVRYAPYNAHPSHQIAHSARTFALPSSSSVGGPLGLASAIPAPVIESTSGRWLGANRIAGHVSTAKLDGVDEIQQLCAQTRCESVILIRGSPFSDFFYQLVSRCGLNQPSLGASRSRYNQRHPRTYLQAVSPLPRVVVPKHLHKAARCPTPL
jgi:hypothetical protein